jgi:hypothetical protein
VFINLPLPDPFLAGVFLFQQQRNARLNERRRKVTVKLAFAFRSGHPSPSKLTKLCCPTKSLPVKFTDDFLEEAATMWNKKHFSEGTWVQ